MSMPEVVGVTEDDAVLERALGYELVFVHAQKGKRMSAFTLLEHSDTVLAALDELANAHQPDAIEREELQRLMIAAVRLYAAKAEAEGAFPIADPGVLTATEVMVSSAALLEAANVNVFELGLWQSWSA